MDESESKTIRRNEVRTCFDALYDHVTDTPLRLRPLTPPQQSPAPARYRVGKPAAVVIGLDSMQGIQTARILRRSGVPVYAVALDKHHHCCRTNTCEEILFANTGTEEMVEALLQLGKRLGTKAVLFPCQDKSVRVVSTHRDRLRQYYHVILPPVEVVGTLMDKLSFHRLAMDRGLRVPATYSLRDRADAVHAAENLVFPGVLKPTFRTQAWDEKTADKVIRIESPEELLRHYDRCREWVESLIVQQWVEGDDSCLYSCNCYFDAESRPLVAFVARKLRQWPPRAGSSCLGEEVRDDTVRDTALELFGGLPYHGLAYLEIKKDARTGEYFIIEPNIGRPTGRSAIAEAGGVALVYTMYCDALGLPLPENRTQKYVGTKWIDLRHDVQSAFSYWREGRLTLRQWWKSWRGRKAHAILSWRDPLPFVFDLSKSAKLAIFGQRTRRKPVGQPGGD